METEKHPHAAVILGGDQRMRYTAELLIEAGCPTTLYGQEQATPPLHFPSKQIADADLLILALPLTRDGVTLNAPFAPAPIPLRELLPHLHKGQTVVGGPFPEALAEAVRQAGATVYDPLGDEMFAQANALATAEGAIALAIAETPDLLFHSRCGILGYGRIARQLAPRLAAMGALPTVYARSAAAREEATTQGYGALALSDLPATVDDLSLIFNTVPHRLFDWEGLLPAHATVIDLAPIYPAQGSRVIRGASLPAFYAPRFAGRLLGKCVLSHWKESEGSV